MAEFKIDGRMTVRKLKENFKNEFEGTLRVYDGRELADDKATLAAIRKGDAKGGEFVCRASRTVGKFEQEMKEVFGIRVQVASPDDYVLALDGITLANLKKIKEKATKADMEELVAYKRKDKSNNTDNISSIVNEAKKEEKICIDKKYADYPIFDFIFKEIDWELNKENIEARREEIDMYGVIFIRAYSEDGDFATKVISNCDIADGLYDAMDDVNDFDDEWDTVKVYYTTVCESYGAGETYERGDEFGYVLSSMLGCEDNWFNYDIDKPVICRIEYDNCRQIWCTDDWGDYCEEIDVDIDLLIEFQKNPVRMADKIEWLEEKTQCLNMNNELLFEFNAEVVYGGKISSNNLIPIEKYEKTGFINTKGEEVIPFKFDSAKDFSSNGLAVVEIDSKYGYINERGEEVIPCKFDNADNFSSNGLAVVEVDGKEGYINEQGEEVIPCKFYLANKFSSNGLAVVEVDDKYGYINEQGEEVIPCKFERADDFSSNGYAVVTVDGKYGVINIKGEYIIPCEYSQLALYGLEELVFVKK